MQKQIKSSVVQYSSPYLCGYRNGHITQTVLIALLGKWRTFLSIVNIFVYTRIRHLVFGEILIPQGSVLGPSLFYVYLKDLNDLDVTTAFISDKSIGNVIKSLEENKEFQFKHCPLIWMFRSRYNNNK